jgi:hypothetical protein
MRYSKKPVNRNHTCKPKVVEREREEKVELKRERERERERERLREREREREEWGDIGWPSALCTAYQASDCNLGHRPFFPCVATRSQQARICKLAITFALGFDESQHGG